MDFARQAKGSHLSRLKGEKLVELVKVQHSQAAINTLLERYWDAIGRWSRILGHKLGLQEADIDDARQEATFWLIKAVDAYDLSQLSRPHPCRFATFLKSQVIWRRLEDFAKHLRRASSHFDSSMGLHALSDVGSEGMAHLLHACKQLLDTAADPATVVERKELIASIHRSLDQFGAWAWIVFESRMRDEEVDVLAAKLHKSVRTAKRRRQQLVELLKRRFGKDV